MKIVDQIAQLFKVKNLLSLAAAVVFVILALTQVLDPKDSMVIIILVFQSFFSYQTNKTKE